MHLDRLSFVLYNSLHTQSHSRLHCVTCSPRCNLLYSSSNSTGAQGYRVKCVYGETNDSQTLVTSSNRKLWKVSVAGNDVTMVYASFLEEMQNTLFASFEKVEDYPMPQLFASAQSEKKVRNLCCPRYSQTVIRQLE